MKKNKFISFASLLDEDSNHSEKRIFNSSEKEAEYDKLTFLWEKCLPEAEEEPNIWLKTQQKIAEDSVSAMSIKTSKRQVQWSKELKYLVAAASIALLVGITYFYQGDDKRSNLAEIAQSLQTVTAQEVKEVTLVVSDKRKIELNNNSQVTYSATGEVQINADKLEEADIKDEYNQIVVPKGKRSQIVLADNSRIWINSGSKVIYPRSFEGKYREIFVEGEVYLKVAHNTEKPFIVNTSGFEVRVLGTSFNVSAYKGSTKATIVLVEGSVDIKDQNEHHIKMVPNEKVELNQAGISGKEKVNALDYISWIDGIWTIQGETLKSVLQHLQEYYGQTIQCDSSVEDEQIFGKLYLNNDLNIVMNSIISTLPIQYTIKNNVIYVKHI